MPFNLHRKLKSLASSIGPGFITGASDDDPSGIATYSQTGAMFGYSQLWLVPFMLPFMVVIQEMCGRIGMVTGNGLSAVVRKYYGRRILFFAIGLLFIANTINIGADLGAMASAAQLIIPLPFTVLLLGMTIITLFMEVFVSYKAYTKVLKYLTLSLFAYIITAIVVKQDWLAVYHSFVTPTFTFSQDYLLNIVAMLGTTISPYLFFWQASEEVEEEVADGKIRAMGRGAPRVTKRDVKRMNADTFMGMLFSQIVTFFIIVTTASTLFAHGIHNVGTAPEAAMALRPFAGDLSFLLFALGVVGTGLLAVPVLAGSASYAFAEAFGLKEGLYRKFTNAHGFYGIISIATIIGLLVNYTSIPPFTLLYYTAILNGICAPPLMILIFLMSNNRKIMGRFTNSFFTNILGIIITVVMSGCAIALLASLILPHIH